MVERVRSQLRTQCLREMETGDAGEQRVAERQRKMRGARERLAELRMAEEHDSQLAMQLIEQHEVDTVDLTARIRIRAAGRDIRALDQSLAKTTQQTHQCEDTRSRRMRLVQVQLQRAQVHTATRA